MYLVKKAIKNLFKNKGRNIVIFLMLSVVILATFVALTIFNATKQIKEETANYYSGEVTIKPKDSSGLEVNISFEDYKKYVENNYLKSYVFYKEMPVYISNLELLDGEYETENKNVIQKSNARLYGMLDEKSMDDFSYGERSIIEGNFPDTSTQCMISNDLAQLNHLNIGDKIQITLGRQEVKCELTISGIFSDSTVERRQANHRSPALNTRNDIITNFLAVSEFDGSFTTASFLLNNPNDLSAFQDELYSKGLSKDYVAEYDSNRYDQALYGINGMSAVVSAFFGIIAAIGMIIIFLVNLFALRERKYEIGVLRAIGMPKMKVATLLISEMLVLAFIGIIFAVISGVFVNPMVIDFMMKLEMEQELPSALKFIVSNLNFAISPIAVLELFVISTFLVLIAGIATISSIMRFNPTQILSERN